MMGLSPDIELERRRDCACPFEDASGPTHPVLGDTCFADCLAAFLSSKFDQILINDYVCQSLQESGGGGDAFYPLYYLDQKWCGLVPKSLFGQDPNVDNIINTCNGINFPNLTDPGVPPQSYQCDLCTQSTSTEANSPTQGPVIDLSTTSTSFATTKPTTTVSLGSTTFLAPSSTSSIDTAAATTATGTTKVTPEYSVPTTASTTTVSHSQDQLPTEAIVAIAVCTALAIAGAVILLLCVLRRRRKQQNDYSSDMRSRISRIVQDFTIPPASSPQPLISPTQSYTTDRPPLTPPLRLRDRKLLPSLLKPLSRPESIVFGPPFDTHHSSNNSNSSQYSVYSQKKKAGVRRGGRRTSFPISPIYSPTSDKLEPRQELTHHKVSSFISPVEPLSPEPSSPPYTRLKSPPPVAFTFPPRSSLDDLHHQCSGSPPPRGPASSVHKGTTSTSTSSSEYNQDYHTSTRSNSTGTTTTVVAPSQQQQQQQQPASIPICPFTPSPPSSPIRPRRPHDEPLEIPDLVTPLTASSSPGPPPSRALPPPPPPPPPGGSASGQTSSAASEIGVATTTTTANTGPAAASRRSPGSLSLRSLPEQQQQQHRQHHRHHESGSGGGGDGGGGAGRAASRDSWGSWGEDTAGGRSIVGVALSGPPPDGTVYPYPDH